MLFLKIRNIHRKTPVLESLFNKIVAKFLSTSILKNICERLLPLNSINMCACHIFTIQCPNIKYESFYLCVTAPLRFKRTIKNLHLKTIK